MTGGTTKQNTSYSSGVNFAPVVSGEGKVTNGNIITGASGGNTSAQSTGATIGVSATIPAGLLMMVQQQQMGAMIPNQAAVIPAVPQMTYQQHLLEEEAGLLMLQNLETTAQYWGNNLSNCPKGMMC